VSLPCEWSWASRLSAASVVAPLGAHYGSHANVVMAEKFLRWTVGHCPSLGLLAAPYLELQELSLISYVKPMENVLPLSPGLGQGKLTIR
jgi:hypothetical protein